MMVQVMSQISPLTSLMPTAVKSIVMVELLGSLVDKGHRLIDCARVDGGIDDGEDV